MIVRPTCITFLILTFTCLLFPLLTHADNTVCPYTWIRTIKVGAMGEDVLKLQQFLNTSIDTAIASSGDGSAGMETSRFGALTKKAVVKFQEKYAADILTPNNLVKGTGMVGAATRTKLNSLCFMPQTSSTVPAAAASALQGSDALTVSDPGQPTSTLVPKSGGVTFTEIKLSAGSKNVVVNGITIKRVGMGSDGAFFSVALVDDATGLQIGNQVSFDSNHFTTFKKAITIPANSSLTVDVVGYMQSDLSSFDGQTPSIEVSDINATSQVQGTFPLMGSAHTLNNSLEIGGVSMTLSSLDPGVNNIRYINDRNILFSAVRMTANTQEDINLTYMLWDQTGTASSNDLANVHMVINGISYPVTVDPDGRTYISLIDPAVVIKKGESIDVAIVGDLQVTGGGRTVEFDLRDNTDDEGVNGATYGLGATITVGGNTALSGAHSAFITDTGGSDGVSGTPFFAGSITTINSGTLISVGR